MLLAGYRIVAAWRCSARHIRVLTPGAMEHALDYTHRGAGCWRYPALANRGAIDPTLVVLFVQELAAVVHREKSR